MSAAYTRRAFASVLALAFLASCTDSGQSSKNGPLNDVQGGPKLARDAGAVLLQASAYDYGLAGALALRRLVAGMLFGVGPGDPATMILVAALLALVAVTAGYIPARRAARVDPAVALRAE